jgi:hypothetical protein
MGWLTGAAVQPEGRVRGGKRKKDLLVWLQFPNPSHSPAFSPMIVDSHH